MKMSELAQRRECAVYLQNKKKPETISRGYPTEMVFIPYVYSGRTHQLAPLYYVLLDTQKVGLNSFAFVVRT